MPVTAETGVASVTRRQAYVTLALIGIITCVSFVDRVMLGVLAPQIKADLGLSDTQLGLVAGFAFTLLYSICGFPLALLADRVSRRWLIALSIAIWSIATAACGLARTFWQLLLTRFVVGFGEAGAGPASFSLICDLFPERERAPAMSIYVFGAMSGTMLGLSLAGWVAARFGWNATFMIVGFPGLLLAVLAAGFIASPARGAQERNWQVRDSPFTARETAAALWKNKPFLAVTVGNGLAAFCTYGMSLWLPSFLTRSHGLTLKEVSVYFGLSFGLALMLGSLAGGALGGYLARRGVHLLYISATCMFSIASLYVVALWVPSAAVAIALIGVCAFLTGLAGPSYTAVTLNIVEPRVRATAQALVTFMNGVIAFAIGTSGVGLLSDFLAPSFGNQSLRWALMIGQLFSLSAAVIYMLLINRERRRGSSAHEVSQALR
jgi:predicted MFS family arabinose efflux permease